MDVLLTYLDEWFPPKERDQLAQSALGFSLRKPYFASYLVVFTFFAFFPVCGLIGFLVTITIITLSTLIFWLSIALLITAAVLTISALFAALAYAYLLGIFLAIRWAKTTFLPSPTREEEIAHLQAEQRRQRMRAAGYTSPPRRVPVVVKTESEYETTDVETDGEAQAGRRKVNGLTNGPELVALNGVVEEKEDGLVEEKENGLVEEKENGLVEEKENGLVEEKSFVEVAKEAEREKMKRDIARSLQ